MKTNLYSQLRYRHRFVALLALLLMSSILYIPEAGLAAPGISSLHLLSVPGDGQEKYGTLKGNVETSDGQPAPFVSVALQGTGYGASTDAGGTFQFRAPAGKYLLIVSSVGLEKKEIDVEIHAGEIVTLPAISLKESRQELKEIIVRAEKESEYKVSRPSPTLRIKTPLLETAQNIQVVTSDVMADQQIFDMLEGVTRNVSGVTKVEHWDNYARLNMRGSKIAAFRNGMNVEMPWGPLAEDMSMVERIEFVKGPAGFMLANGEPSGFYNVVTKKPTGITKGEATFTVGSFDTYRTTLDLDGKLSKDGKLLYRLNLMGQMKGSHRDYEFNNRYSIVPVIKYRFNDRTSLTAEYTYQYSRMSVIGSNYVFAPEGYGGLSRHFSTAEPNIDPSDIKDHSIFLTLEHQLNPGWSLTAKLAYFNYKLTGSSLWPDSLDAQGNLFRGISIWDAFNESRIGQVFVNGDLQTGPVKHRILAGLDMSYKNYMADWGQHFSLGDTFNIYNPVHGIAAGEIPQFDRSRSLRIRAGSNIIGQSYNAVYIQDELHFWRDRVRLTLAGRFTSIKETEYGSDTDDREVTPRIGLSVSIDPQTSAYAVYDQAFVPQTGVDFFGNAFNPITGSNIEAGLKKDWFGGSWNSTLAVYQITKNNVLTADPEHINYSIQLGQTKTKGLELDIRGEILQGLNLTVNYAYTDSEISKDTDESVVGNATPGSTKHINNAWLSYRLPGEMFGGVGISLGYQWQIERSSWYVFDGSEYALPDYFRMDGAVSWQNENLSMALNINNILDQYLYSGSPYGDFFYWQTEPGTNFRLSVGYKF